MNPYLVFILAIMVGTFILNIIVEKLNLRHFRETLPDEFTDCYDPEKYQQSQRYLRENTRFELVQSSVHTPIVIVFMLAGGFNCVDLAARSFGCGPVLSGLIFTGMLAVGMQVLDLPFSIYDTFVIESRYGFNKTTVKTFIVDLFKGWGVTILVGAPIIAGVFWFFEQTGSLAWLYAWGAVTVVQIVLMFVAPVVIMPIFNTFEPLEDGELKQAIESYAHARNFKLKGVYTMDGSRRSTKSNAFFTGFGKFRRIVLFDTLIEKHSVDELVAILAHEMGHFKKRHIHKFVLISIISTGLMLYILSLFITSPDLFQAFGMEHISVYAGIVFFGFLYSPISMVISTIVNSLSRRFEYEADRYAADTYGKPDALISGLKTLSVDNLSNLTPHPLKVWLEYSHPPVLDRIRALRNAAGSSAQG